MIFCISSQPIQKIQRISLRVGDSYILPAINKLNIYLNVDAMTPPWD